MPLPEPTDFSDVTKSPDPTPKKKYHFAKDGMDWTAGQTFQQALAAALPAALRGKTLSFNAKIDIGITVNEV